MPELPEVETIRRDLEPLILHQRLIKLEVLERVHLLKNCSAKELQSLIAGKFLDEIDRRGKFLLFKFGEDVMILHLRMSGRLLTVPAKHTRLFLEFDNNQTIYFDDARRFGMLHLVHESELEDLPAIKQLGQEPLSSEFSFKCFSKALTSSREIKQVLLDQRVIAGLGNIYASEALYGAKIHPARRATSLSRAEARTLFNAIPAILQHAIEAGGTSIRDYATPSGELGNFQEEFQVYSLNGRPCARCRTPIERIVQGGRSSFFCPACQPLS